LFKKKFGGSLDSTFNFIATFLLLSFSNLIVKKLGEVSKILISS